MRPSTALITYKKTGFCYEIDRKQGDYSLYGPLALHRIKGDYGFLRYFYACNIRLVPSDASGKASSPGRFLPCVWDWRQWRRHMQGG